jgi:quercetin dioxygenase-like cupin family protein
MKPRLIGVVTIVALGLCLWPLTATAQKFAITTLAEKQLKTLPEGPLYWRIETFPTLFDAEAAAGPTGLAAEAAGRAWLFTLGPQGGSTPGGRTIVEIGPVPPFAAPEYLLRIIQSGGPPGAKTPVHTHPGSEAFYVLAGEQTQRTPHGVTRLEGGQSMPGHGPDTVMEVSSSGTTELNQLVMFLVDATKPFTAPAEFPSAQR